MGHVITRIAFDFLTQLYPNLESKLREDIKIPHSTMTKTYLETLATCLLNVCDKSQKAICTICWGYRITM